MNTQLDREYVAQLSKCSPVYQEMMAERTQIDEHKWLESEKIGRDIGFEKALLSWVRHHKYQWLRYRRIKPTGND
ncbi:MAG: hypothetical protein O3C20_05870 [Verrucomicrobia bacterium]|nr:hypothetical protein [Verrucomicrobiota bacterium]